MMQYFEFKMSIEEKVPPGCRQGVISSIKVFVKQMVDAS